MRRPHGAGRRTRRTLLGALTAVALVTALTTLPASPAVALHQHCGKGYPDGTLPNGHPDLSAAVDGGWAGSKVLNGINGGVFAVSTLKSKLLDAASVANAVKDISQETEQGLLILLPDEVEGIAIIPVEVTAVTQSVVAQIFIVAATAATVAETALMATQRKLAGSIGAANACNAVLGGDMLNDIWISMVERNLASNGPPLALLLTPTDSGAHGNSGPFPLRPQHQKGDFPWCPKIDLPTEIPTPSGPTDLDQPDGPSTGGDCTPTYHDGFLTVPYDDAPAITVQAIVRDTIDHAKAHGLLSGDELAKANDEFSTAMDDVGQKLYKLAFRHFRTAYQTAVGYDG